MNRALLISLALGFVTASPVGPMGLLCLRRTLSGGVTAGLISALGIAMAYGFWAFAAVHGLATASRWIADEKTTLEAAIGAFFLLYGANGTLNAPSTIYPTLQRRRERAAAEFTSTFLVVALNPATFVMFSALFTVFDIARAGRIGFAASLAIGAAVSAGAMAFWISATQLVQRARASIHSDFIRWVSLAASCVIALFGLSILLVCLWDFLHGEA